MDNWVLLMKKQKHLKAIEIESVDRDFLPEVSLIKWSISIKLREEIVVMLLM